MEKRHNLFDAFVTGKSRGKKVIALALAALMVFCFMPALAWQNGDDVAYGEPDENGYFSIPAKAETNPYDSTSNPSANEAYEELYKEGGVADKVSAAVARYNTLKDTPWAEDEGNTDSIEELKSQIDDMTTSFSAILESISALATAETGWDENDETAYTEYNEAKDQLSAAGILGEDGEVNESAAEAELDKYAEGTFIAASPAYGDRSTSFGIGKYAVTTYYRTYHYTVSGGGEYWRALFGISSNQVSYDTKEYSNIGFDYDTLFDAQRVLNLTNYDYGYIWTIFETDKTNNTYLGYLNFIIAANSLEIDLGDLTYEVKSYSDFTNSKSELEGYINTVNDIETDHPGLLDKHDALETAKEAPYELIGGDAEGDGSATGIFALIGDFDEKVTSAESLAGTAHFTLSLTDETDGENALSDISLYYDDKAEKQKSNTYKFNLVSEEGLEAGEGNDYTVAYNVTNEDIEAFDYNISGDTITITPQEQTSNDVTLSIEATITMINENYTGYDPIVNGNPLSISVKVTDKLTFESSETTHTVNIGTGDAYRDYTFSVAAQGGKSPVTYAFGETTRKDDRITINESTGEITVKKDTNKTKDGNAAEDAGAAVYTAEDEDGYYLLEVVATDGAGQTTKQTVKLIVTNAYDDAYDAMHKELTDIQEDINTYLSLIGGVENLDTSLQAIVKVLLDTTAFESIWNEGNPQFGRELILPLIEDVELDSWIWTLLNLAQIYDIDDLIEAMPATTLNINKQDAVEGYSFDILNVSFNLSPLGFYYDIVDTAWTTFTEDLGPVMSLSTAADEFQKFVFETNYADLTSVKAVNDYVKTLRDKYAAIDDALIALNNSTGITKTLVDLVLKNMDSILRSTLNTALTSGGSVLEALIPSLGNDALEDIVGGLYDDTSGFLDEQIDNLEFDADITLSDIVGYSAQIRVALEKLAGVSALITGAVEFGKGFEISQYDLTQIDKLYGYVRGIYKDYYEAVGNAAGLGLENPTGILLKLDGFKKQLMSHPDVETAIDVYWKIVGVYNVVNDVVGWVSSGKAQEGFEAAKECLIAELTGLAQRAADRGEEILKAKIQYLIVKIKNAAVEELIEIGGEVRGAIQDALTELGEDLKPLADFIGSAMITAYDKAEDAFWTAVRVVKAAHNISQYINTNIGDFIDFMSGLDFGQMIENLYADAQKQAEYVAAYIDAALRAIPNPKIAASGSGYTTFTTTGDAINFTTDVDWVFDALQKIGVAKPVYALTSGDSDIEIDGIFTLSKDGALTLNGGVDQYKNGDYGIRVDLIFSADTKFMPHVTDELMKRLNSWFGQLDMTVKVDLTLDRTALSAAITTAEAITTPGSKSQAASYLLQEAIDEANDAYKNATKQTDIDYAAEALAEAIAAFNDSIDIAELAATIATGDALVLGAAKSQAAYDLLQEAIEAANAIYEGADVGAEMVQGDIDDAVTALETAIAAYIAFNNTALTVTIADAAAIQQGAKSLAAFNDLLSAIETARNARGAATQGEINTALSNLLAAIATFYGSPDETTENQTTVVSVDRFALATTLTQATVTVRGNKGATAFTILQSAIAAANTVFFNANATQEEVDAARLALSNAIIAFNNSADEAIDGGEGEDEGEDTTLTPLAAQTPPDSDEPEDTTDGDEPVENIGEVLDPESNEIGNEPEATPPDEEPVVSEIPGQDVPQSSGADVGAGTPGAAAPSESRGTWSLVNLLLGIIAVLLMAWILARHAIAPGRGKKSANGLAGRYTEKRAPRKTAVLIVGALCSIAVILLFVLTENIQLPMGAANGNTVFYAGAVAIEIAVLAFSSKKAESIYNAKA